MSWAAALSKRCEAVWDAAVPFLFGYATCEPTNAQKEDSAWLYKTVSSFGQVWVHSIHYMFYTVHFGSNQKWDSGVSVLLDFCCVCCGWLRSISSVCMSPCSLILRYFRPPRYSSSAARSMLFWPGGTGQAHCGFGARWSCSSTCLLLPARGTGLQVPPYANFGLCQECVPTL